MSGDTWSTEDKGKPWSRPENQVADWASWVTFVDAKLGLVLMMDPTKHTPTQVNATYKVLEFIATTHKFSADRPEDSSTQPPVRP